MTKKLLIDVEYPGGAPRSLGVVSVKLIGGSAGAVVSGAVVGDAVEVVLDDQGHGEIDLATNDVEVTSPATSFYRVTVLDSSPTISRSIEILDAMDPEVSWTDEAIQVADPVDPQRSVSAEYVTVGAESLTNYLADLAETGGSVSAGDVTVPADSTGIFDPDTSWAWTKAKLMAAGADESTAEAIAAQIVASLEGVDPSTLPLLVDNIGRMSAFLLVGLATLGSDLSTKEAAGVAAGLIADLMLGSASQADAGDFAAAGHNHDGSYSALGHNHAGVYDPAGTAAGLVAALVRPNGPRIYAPGSEAAMLALTAARQGDYAFRADQGTRIYVLTNDDASSLGNWQILRWNDSEPIAKALVSAKGSIVGASAALTPVDVPVGPAGTVLAPDPTATAGIAWVKPTRTHAFRSGEYTGLIPYSANATVNNNRLHYNAVTLTKARRFTRIGIYHASGVASAGSVCRLGLWAPHATDDVAGALITEFGSVPLDTAAAAMKYLAIDVTLQPGDWYFGSCYQFTGTTPQLGVGSAVQIAPSTDFVSNGFKIQSSVSGALPNPAVPAASTATQAAVIYLWSA